MAKLLADWKTAHPDEYKTLMSALNAENSRCISALEALNAQGDTATRRLAFKTAFDTSRVLTRDLLALANAPYELPVHTSLIEASGKNGAFVCRLPGGGGDDGIAALCLTEDDKLKLEKFWASYGAKATQPVQLGVSSEGVRVEPSSAFDAVESAAGV
jgi:phosphomevalonate kinase